MFPTHIWLYVQAKKKKTSSNNLHWFLLPPHQGVKESTKTGVLRHSSHQTDIYATANGVQSDPGAAPVQRGQVEPDIQACNTNRFKLRPGHVCLTRSRRETLILVFISHQCPFQSTTLEPCFLWVVRYGLEWFRQSWGGFSTQSGTVTAARFGPALECKKILDRTVQWKEVSINLVVLASFTKTVNS